MIVGKPFLTVDQIQKKVKELADRISEDYEGKELLAVGILKGAFIFFSDIVRLIRVPLVVDFLIASSYIRSEGMLFEHYFWHALKLQGPFFFMRPVSLLIILSIVLIFVIKPLKARMRRASGKTPVTEA